MTHQSPDPALMTIPDFCRRYSISAPTVYRLVARGDLRLTKIGRSTRIRAEEAERWASALPVSKHGTADQAGA